MKDLNQQQTSTLQLRTMNKPTRQKSNAVQKLQTSRSPASFEKTKKMMMLAASISDALEEKGWNKKDLAKAMDQYESVISKWLSGTHNFTIDTLFDIEQALGIILVSSQKNKTLEFVNRYEYTITVKAEDIAEYPGKNFLNFEEAAHKYIAISGGMAAKTIVISSEN